MQKLKSSICENIKIKSDLISLRTDFYQLSMIAAYIVNDKANRKTGFEGFFRHVKKAVNPITNFYIFDGATEVTSYIEQLKQEIKTEEFLNTFLSMVMPKVTADKSEIENIIRNKWVDLETDFVYNIVPNGSIIFPYVPVFQYEGPAWIGQLIETYVTNIYNGKTGLATINYLIKNKGYRLEQKTLDFIEGIMCDNPDALDEYENILNQTAIKFRKSTNKILLEAAFRRCPTYKTAECASKIALNNGWDGTSNTSLWLDGYITDNQIGGTMAHAFVMSFNNEQEAFIAWDRIFPGTTFLIDTYDVEESIEIIDRLVKLDKITKPNDVRIDSDPLDTYAIEVHNYFENKIGIFLSGDMNDKKFKDFSKLEIPYTKAMAGTKYVYNDPRIEMLNAGFVYKIVEYEDNGKSIKPIKKATGKKNYPGLKQCVYNEIDNKLIISTDKMRGFFNFAKINESTTLVFEDGNDEN